MKERKYFINKQELQTAYNKLGTIAATAKYFSVPYGVIYRRLLVYNIPILKPRIAKLECDHRYFSNINTQEKAYWLGFLAGKATLRVRKNNYQISIQANNKDIDHLRRFLAVIKCNAKLVSTGRNFSATFSSSQMFSDLDSHGIYFPKRSRNVRFSQKMLKSKYLRHYIRGFIDSKAHPFFSRGSWYLAVSGNYAMLSKVQKYLEDGLNLKHSKSRIRRKLGQNWGCVMTFAGNKSVPKIWNFLDKNAQIRMERKRV